MSATEIQKVEQGSAIAVLETENVQELIQSNLDGLRIQFERVKIPTSGGQFFQMIGEDGEPVPTKEIVGIIIDHYPVNAYWADDFGGGNNPPQCSALDGKTGVGDPGGNCLTCPKNQWGSDGEGRGKACKNLHRLYVLPQGDILPLLIAAPPTSLGNIASYMQFLTKKSKRLYWSVLTRIKLETATNKDNIQYARLTFARAGDIPVEKLAALSQYIKEIKPLLRTVEVQAGDYNTEEADSAQPQSEPF